MDTIWLFPNPTPAESLRDPATLCNKLRFTVPYTTPEAARAALRVAERLAGDLGAVIDLISVQVIPMICPLMPDARTAFFKEQLGRVVGESQVPVWPKVILTRDLALAFRRLLPLSSPVLIAVPDDPFERWIGREAWWARRFKRAGYEVVLIPPSS